MTINTWNCLHFTGLNYTVLPCTPAQSSFQRETPLSGLKRDEKQTISLCDWTVMQKIFLVHCWTSHSLCSGDTLFGPKEYATTSTNVFNYFQWLLMLYWWATRTCLCDTSRGSPQFLTRRLIRVQVSTGSTCRTGRNIKEQEERLFGKKGKAR